MTRCYPAAPRLASCPHRRLRRLLSRELPRGLTLGASTLRPWASANFVGARHQFACAFDDGEAELPPRALGARLNAAEWHLPGHIVADAVVESADAPGGLRIEILTVED